MKYLSYFESSVNDQIRPFLILRSVLRFCFFAMTYIKCTYTMLVFSTVGATSTGWLKTALFFYSRIHIFVPRIPPLGRKFLDVPLNATEIKKKLKESPVVNRNSKKKINSRKVRINRWKPILRFSPTSLLLTFQTTVISYLKGRKEGTNNFHNKKLINR